MKLSKQLRQRTKARNQEIKKLAEEAAKKALPDVIDQIMHRLWEAAEAGKFGSFYDADYNPELIPKLVSHFRAQGLVVNLMGSFKRTLHISWL